MAQAEQVLLAGPSDEFFLEAADRPTTLPWPHDLSPRDLSVLQLLANGSSTAGIADALAYSESTIKNVIHELVHRLGARNRAHAVALAIRAGVI